MLLINYQRIHFQKGEAKASATNLTIKMEPKSAKKFSLKVTVHVSIVLTLLLLPMKAMAKEPCITLDVKNVQLEFVLREIEKQSGYSFWYMTQDIRPVKSVTIKVTNASVEETLNLCLRDHGLTYRIDKGNIILRRKVRGVVMYTRLT